MRALELNGKFYEEIFHWTSRFPEGQPYAKCVLRLYSNEGKIIGMIEKIPEMFFRKYTETIAGLVFERCQREYGHIALEDFHWIEFYPKEANIEWKDQYYSVQAEWDGTKFVNPQWEEISFDKVRSMIGIEPPKSLLKENPYKFTDDEKDGLFSSLTRCLETTLVPARWGGFLNAPASEYHLFEQTKDGHYLFGHPETKKCISLTRDGKLLIPESAKQN